MHTWTDSVTFLFSAPHFLLSVLFFFSPHHVNYIYPQRDCLCLRVWEQLSKREERDEGGLQKGKQRRTQRKREENIDLQRKGRVWSASRAYMMNGREIGKATLSILLLFNLSLSLAFFLLPPFLTVALSAGIKKKKKKGFLCSSAQASHTAKNIRLIYTAVIRPLDLKQSGTHN